MALFALLLPTDEEGAVVLIAPDREVPSGVGIF